MKRHVCSLCQTCYEQARPDEYFPATFRIGDCCGCGDEAFVGRVTRQEADTVADSLFGEGDRPHDLVLDLVASLRRIEA